MNEKATTSLRGLTNNYLEVSDGGAPFSEKSVNIGTSKCFPAAFLFLPPKEEVEAGDLAA